MSRLERFMGKPKEFDFGVDKLVIPPLDCNDLPDFFDMADSDKRGRALKSIVMKTLERAVPDSTVEERQRFGMQHMEALINAIMEVNGMSKDVSVTKANPGTASKG